MLYDSSKHGLIEISEMPLPHVKNALAKLVRKNYKVALDYELIGAMKQSIAERETGPDASSPKTLLLVKAQLDKFNSELKEVKEFHKELKQVVNKY